MPPQTYTTYHAPRLQDLVCLITGASSGLGRQIALAYASHGAKLVVCADLQSAPVAGSLDEEEGLQEKTTADAINGIYGEGKAVFVKCDVQAAAEVKEAVAKAVEVGGRLDVMVNNAGVGPTNRKIRIHEMDDGNWEREIRINLTGVYLGCKHACAQFITQDPHPVRNRRGWIVNVSSVMGQVATGNGTMAYCASKAGVLNMSKQIAVDYAKDRVHCNAICPGFAKSSLTRTDFENEAVYKRVMAATPWGNWGSTADIARTAVFLVSEDASWVTGVGLPVDGGYLAR